jgi:hypothetical protein
MSESKPTQEPVDDALLALIAEYCDGTITDDDRRRLEAQLDGNAAAQALYLDYTLTNAVLAWNWRGGKPLVENLPSPAEEPRPSHDRLGERVARKIEWRRHPVYFTLTVAVTGVLAWIAFAIFVNPNRDRDAGASLPANAPGQSGAAERSGGAPLATLGVARMTRGIRAVWSEGDIAEGAWLVAGRRIDLASGLSEIVYESGARVVVEGPALLHVTDGNSLTLERGRIVAKVPPRAVGFAVATAHATFIDLGTEFGVEIDRATDDARLQVFVGSVAMAPPGSSEVAASGRVVKAGETVRVDREGGVIDAEDAQQSDGFVRGLPSVAREVVFLPNSVARIFAGRSRAVGAPSERISVYTVGANVQRTLLQFDLSRIPRDRTIVSAMLKLTVVREESTLARNPGNRPMDVFRIGQEWHAATTHWTAARRGVAWRQPGGDALGTQGNQLTDPYASSSADPGPGGGVSWDVTDLVREWCSGESANHGLLLRSQPGNRLTFYAAHSDGDQMPRLEIRLAPAGNSESNVEKPNAPVERRDGREETHLDTFQGDDRR